MGLFDLGTQEDNWLDEEAQYSDDLVLIESMDVD